MSDADAPIRLDFHEGTLRLSGPDAEQIASLPGVQFDSRTQVYRAEARHYREIVEIIRGMRWAYIDEARSYGVTPWKLNSDREPYPHQREGVEAWWTEAHGRGVVVLPTGSGKTFVGMLAIQRAARPTIVLTPTLNLMTQWQNDLSKAFGGPVGAMGGGEHSMMSLTVTTYDSAYIHLERWGNKFGLVIFDECHHLPGPSYSHAAIGAIAPFRLGLTATPERTDGGEAHYDHLIGPIAYRAEITELSGEYLSQYMTERVYIELTPAERTEHEKCRETYKHFIADRGISMSGPGGWKRFLQEATRSPQGWEAFQAFHRYKAIERGAAGKFAKLEELLAKHKRDRSIIFTADNDTVYRIARLFFVPPLTHQTPAKERKQILERFQTGEYNTIVTSRVLNEGVDVPAANVGIVLSGSGTIRENVQRLGRILRKYPDKQAVLYELVTQDTTEQYISDRRRQHDAFR